MRRPTQMEIDNLWHNAKERAEAARDRIARGVDTNDDPLAILYLLLDIEYLENRLREVYESGTAEVIDRPFRHVAARSDWPLLLNRPTT
jgi:hypothetical protein